MMSNVETNERQRLQRRRLVCRPRILGLFLLQMGITNFVTRIYRRLDTSYYSTWYVIPCPMYRTLPMREPVRQFKSAAPVSLIARLQLC